MTATDPGLRTGAVTAAVTHIAARCDGPTLATLTIAGDTVTARLETLPGGVQTADSITAACAGMAGLITRHPTMFPAEVAGYAVILPGERVAFAADRTGFVHFIELPGVPAEPVHSHRWDTLTENIVAMVDALPR